MKSTDRVEAFLELWHRAIAKKDLDLLAPSVASGVVLISPALHRPKEGKESVLAILRDVLASLDNYTVSKTWVDGDEILLEFDAKVGAFALQGVDKITLDSEGRLIQLKVYIRPFKGLQALIASVVKLQIGRMGGIRRWIAQITFALKSRL